MEFIVALDFTQMAASLGRLGYFTEYMQEIDIKFALNPKLKKHLGVRWLFIGFS